MNKDITKVRVVTSNFFVDFIARIKNMFGLRLNKYEEMIKKAKDEIWLELKEQKIKLKWYRYEISQLTNGAMVIMLYGEKE